MADDYDSPWKEAIERHFADFLYFYFPAAHARIDWSQPISFLEQELREVVPDAEMGTRFVDKLVKVTQMGGQDDWLYIHLEIQSQAQDAFAERMFVYNYRLYDRYRHPIASLALLADDRANWRPTAFSYEVLDCHMGIRFPIAKLLDWAGSEARLNDMGNPFSIVTLAHLSTRATRNDMAARRAAKWATLRGLCQRNWPRQKVIDFIRVIDWMMRLPKTMELELKQDRQTWEEAMGKPYVTSFERYAREEGIELGLKQGIEQGIAQGIQQGKKRLLSRLLEQRFGELPQWATERMVTASDEQLDAWTSAIFSADSIAGVFIADQQ
ncbi:MAG: hypothetical protein RL404_1305 [Pseudomonadota bacterium]